MERKLIRTAALLGMIAIILGAFGAHALKERLTIEQLGTFETGVRYQMYHALMLLFVGLSQNGIAEKTKKGILYLAVWGVLLFSGSIYILATKNITGLDITAVGMITPVGGFLLIISWFWLFISFMQKKS